MVVPCVFRHVFNEVDFLFVGFVSSSSRMLDFFRLTVSQHWFQFVVEKCLLFHHLTMMGLVLVIFFCFFGTHKLYLLSALDGKIRDDVMRVVCWYLVSMLTKISIIYRNYANRCWFYTMTAEPLVLILQRGKTNRKG